MIKDIVSKLMDIYKSVLDVQIEEKEFIKGNLINNLNLDSLVSLQIISEIERKFGLIIEEDETAILLIDSPYYFIDYYILNKLKLIYENILNMEIDTNQISKGNLIRKYNINIQNVMIIKKEIEKNFGIEIDDNTKIYDIINYPFLCLKRCQETWN